MSFGSPEQSRTQPESACQAKEREVCLNEISQECRNLGEEIEGCQAVYAQLFPHQTFTSTQHKQLATSIHKHLGNIYPEQFRAMLASPEDAKFILEFLKGDCEFLNEAQSFEITQRTSEISQRIDAKKETKAEQQQTLENQKEEIISRREKVASILGKGNLNELEAKLLASLGKDLDEEEYKLGKELIAMARAKLESLSSLAKTEEEQAFFQQIVQSSSIDFSAATADVMFADTAQKINHSNLSEAKKQMALKRLGVIATGTQLINTLKETVTDPQTGETRPRYDKDHPLIYRKGLEAYINETGTKTLRVALSDGRVREIPVTTENPTQMRTMANMLAIYSRLEEAGISHFMGEPYHIETDLYHQTDISHTWRVAKTMEALLGGHTGYNGEIIRNEDLDFLVWQAQYFSRQGDAAAGDYDIKTTQKNLTDLGIRKKDGSMNYEILSEAGSFMREQYITGSPDYYLLQKHLRIRFPNRVPLNGQN